ncbi:MAG: trypsin-like serine protease [Myxococcales bacterium]|nr:trypsin-like serine protease [Myxococcales bacterium]
MKRLVLPLLLGLAACGPIEDAPAEAPSPGQRGDEIVGGTATSGDPNVFMLILQGNNGQGSLCTATLIDRRTLLTAAHCVDPRILGATSLQIAATNAPTQGQIAPGVNTWQVVETRMHSTWNPATLSGDIAVALLASAPNVTPKAWNQASVASGQAVRSVGYGTIGNDTGSGVKRTVDLLINQASPTLIFVGNGVNKGICHGDSGGPTFRTFSDGVERVVGVHSFTRTEDCTDGAATRVDAYRTFVQQWLAEKEAATCNRDGRCVQGCPQVDLDCVCGADGQCTAACPELNVDPDCGDCGGNGVCADRSCPLRDPDCVDEGRPCTSATQCVGRRCVLDPQHSVPYCSRACSTSAACSAGYECDPAGYCRFAQLPPAGVGEPCTPGGTFCGERGVCTGSLAGVTRCQVSCVTASDCPKDFTCVVGLDSQRYCLEPPKPPILLRKASIDGQAASGCSAGPGLFPALGLLLLLRRRKSPP